MRLMAADFLEAMKLNSEYLKIIQDQREELDELRARYQQPAVFTNQTLFEVPQETNAMNELPIPTRASSHQLAEIDPFDMAQEIENCFLRSPYANDRSSP